MIEQVPLGRFLLPAGEIVALEPDQQYRIAGIYSFGKGLFERTPIWGAETSYQTLTRLRGDQFVVSKLNGWEGAVDVVTQMLAGCLVSNEYPVFSIDREQAEPAYVRWIARWPTFWDRLVPRGSMVRRKRVQVSQLLEVTVPLPELEQQRRTVAELEIVQAATNRIATLGKRSDTFVSALPRLVDEVVGRASSRRAFVGDLVDLVSDTVHPGDSPGDARSFVGLQHVERHTGRRTGADPIEAMKGRKFRFRPGDVIYGYLRPYLNKVWAADRHGLCSVDQYVLRPKPTVTPEVIAYVLRGQSVLDQTIALTHSLQLPRLRSGLLLSLEVPVVAGPEAAEVLKRLDRLRDQVVTIATLRDRRARATNALVPAALNRVFGPG